MQRAAKNIATLAPGNTAVIVLEPNDRVIPRFKCHGHKAKIKTRYPIRVHFYRRLVSVKVWAAAATYLWFFRYGNT